MTRFPFRRSAMGVSLGLAVAFLSVSVLASTPVSVTFPANSVWAQEIGSVSHSDSSRDYTVAVAAGNTFKINLLTRNPNVNFKVKDETHDKQLLDSSKTGVSTWELPISTAATYTIHVFVDPGTIEAGQDAKYALQIGQYGAKDLRPPATVVAFQDNKPWVQEDGSLDTAATTHDFTVAIAAGKTLRVNLLTSNPQLHFKVADQTHNQQLVDSSTTSATTWSLPVATAATYMIQVYVEPAGVTAGQKVPYSLQIGQATAGAAPAPNPAGTTSAAMPGATGSMPAAAATTATPK